MDWEQFEKESYLEFMRQQREKDDQPGILTDEELEQIVLISVQAWMEANPYDDPECQECFDWTMKVVRWAEGVMVDHDLLGVVVKGLIYPKEIAGERVEPDFLFSLTPNGEQVGEELERRRASE